MGKHTRDRLIGSATHPAAQVRDAAAGDDDVRVVEAQVGA
jgi:hypothetical protein